MEKKINIYQIDAFTDRPFNGNPAGVTFGDELTSQEMQSIAKEMNLAETAFLSKSDNADYHLRWFTPTIEVDLCGHATIASLHFLKENNLLKEGQEITFETLSGILKCKFENNRYFMQIPVYTMEEFTGCKEDIFDSLGIERNDVDDDFPVVLVENGYIYIKVKSLEALHNMKPDYKSLYKLNEQEQQCVAVYTLETVDKTSFAHSRFFAPYFGIDEDPVTGSMNGPLLPVLIYSGIIKNNNEEHSYVFEQGDILGRKGRVGVTFNTAKNELFISGNAVTMLKGEMAFTPAKPSIMNSGESS